MATLTADTPQTWVSRGDTIDGIFECDGTIYAGQCLQWSTGGVGQVKTPADDATTGFAGIALEGGTDTTKIKVRQQGALLTTVASGLTVGAGDEKSLMYADTSGTANNNPGDCTTTSTNNMPIGQMTEIKVLGSGGTVVVNVQADGFSGAVTRT